MTSGASSVGRVRAATVAVLAVWITAVVATTVAATGWPTDNRVARWVGQLGENEGWDVLVERFGGDEFVLLRVTGASLDDGADRAALAEVRRQLAAEPSVTMCADALLVAGLGGAAASGAGADGPLGTRLSRDPVVRALDLVGAGAARYDFVLALRADATPSEREQLVATLERQRSELRQRGWRTACAGHPLVASALDEEARAVERRFAPALGVLATVVVALFLRSLGLALAVLLPAALAAAAPRAALRALGVDSDLILVALGPLCFVLLLASTLHLATAFARHRRTLSVAEARRAAVREKLPAGLLAAATTAVGFGVFLASDLRSVSTLGATVGVTMLVGVPLAFACSPPLFVLHDARVPHWLRRLRWRRVRSPEPTAERATRATPWRRVALRAARARGWVRAGAGLLLVFGAWAAATLPSETNALHYFPAGHPARSDFLALEATGSGLSTVDVLVRRTAPWSDSELFELGLGAVLTRVSGVTGVVGPETFASRAALPGPLSTLTLAGRVDRERVWARWTVRFPTRESSPTRALVDRVRGALDAWAADRSDPGLERVVAGSVPSMLTMQAALVATLAGSLALTALVTTLCFALIVRSTRGVVAAVVANILPVAATLGAARILSIPLDGATVMVAAVVLGLAVDNTLHLLHAAQHGASGSSAPRSRGLRAQLRAFDTVGRAAFVSSLALALGFGALALSGFAPTARFGLLCAIGSLAALVSDLVVLPAFWLAAGPPMRPSGARPR